MSDSSVGSRTNPRSRRHAVVVAISCILAVLSLVLIGYVHVVEETRVDITNLEIAFRAAAMTTVAGVLWLASAAMVTVIWIVTFRRRHRRTAGMIATTLCLLPPAFMLDQVRRWNQPSPAKLVEAAAQGNLAQAERQLAAGVSANAVPMRRLAFHYGESKGGTPLGAAINNQHIEMVKLLIQNGAEIDRRDNSKPPPLQQAILYGGPAIVDLLLSKGAKLTDNNWNAVTWAAYAASGSLNQQRVNTKAVFDVLVRHGADLESPAIHELVMQNSGDPTIAQHLARLRRARRASPANAKTDWLNAIALGEDEAAMHLLAAQSLDRGDKEQLLALAAKFGVRGTAEQLIDSGARVDWPEHFGRVVDSPLNLAVSYGHIDIARLLIQRHADVNAVYQTFFPPLVHAVASDHIEVARMLIDAGADVNQPMGGRTPLMVAAANGNIDMIKLLIDQGAQTDVKAHGRTLIDEARGNGHHATVQYLTSLTQSGA